MWIDILNVVIAVILGFIGLILLYLLFVFVCTRFVNLKKDYDKDSKFFRFLLYFNTWVVLKLCGVKVNVTGMEKLPEGRFLMVSNHLSAFDALSTWLAFRKNNLACISKPSNFKIPLGAEIAKRCCFLAIDRDNARNALKTVQKASELMINDQASILVYPEGTRSETGELLPFHNMMFRIAQKAKVPVVVCSIRGSDQVKKRAPWRTTNIYIDVIDVIPTQDVVDNHTNVTGEKAFNLIKDNLEKRSA
jgi:1-acyl-sn-glycerol-3-phosphate acyltransferase